MPYDQAMDWALVVFMIFPAFLIGSVFGILVGLALTGSNLLKDRAFLASPVAGALLGIVVFLLTAGWWPPVIGPFILSPAGAVAASLIAVLAKKNG
jgi:hypothetical protein